MAKTVQKTMQQQIGSVGIQTTTRATDYGCDMIPVNGPFGNRTIGPRTVIVPADPIIWDEGTSYPYLTLVASEDFGQSYVSKKDVPAGTPLANTEYWIPAAQFNAQLAQIMKDLGTINDNIAVRTVFNVPEMYGAKGDGVTNDTAALNTWLASGASLALSPGKTYLFSTLTIPETVATIEGFNSTLQSSGDVGDDTFCVTVESTNCNIQNLRLKCSGKKNGLSSQATRATYRNIRIEDFTNIGLQTSTGTTAGYEAVFDSVFIVGSNLATYGVYVRRADCVFSNILIQDCQTAMRFDQGSTLITNVHAWINQALEFSQSNMLYITTPDQIIVNGAYCDTMECFVNVPTSVEGTAKLYAAGVIFLAPEGDQQYIARTYAESDNTNAIHVTYSHTAGRLVRLSPNPLTFKGMAEKVERLQEGSDGLVNTSPQMNSQIAWGFQTGLPNTPDSGLSVFYQLGNYGYACMFDLTSTQELTASGGYVVIGTLPPNAFTLNGVRSFGMCIVGDKAVPMAVDFDSKTIMVSASANIPTSTRIAGSLVIPMFMV